MTIDQALINFKDLIDKAILAGGTPMKNAIIRTSRPIQNLHEAVKHQLIESGAHVNMLHPPLGKRSPELKLAGFLKQKDQDVCLTHDMPRQEEELVDGLLDKVMDPYGKDYTEKTLVINIRSQISSIHKNFDTLFERTFSEAINLHSRCPRMVMGEVYMIAIPEYGSDNIKEKKLGFKNLNPRLVEKYIKSFNSINSRTDTNSELYKYEAVALLIVDFSGENPKLFTSTEELIEKGYLPAESTVNYDTLTWSNFSTKLLSEYNLRFNEDV